MIGHACEMYKDTGPATPGPLILIRRRKYKLYIVNTVLNVKFYNQNIELLNTLQ